MSADANGWMPIETAPRDGTVIDLWITDGKGWGTREVDCAWGFSGNPRRKQWTQFDMGERFPAIALAGWSATHWMHVLPPAPVSA